MQQDSLMQIKLISQCSINHKIITSSSIRNAIKLWNDIPKFKTRKVIKNFQAQLEEILFIVCILCFSLIYVLIFFIFHCLYSLCVIDSLFFSNY